MNIYIVEALRWGDRELHSYVVGAYSTIEYATAAAAYETDGRGGKYECVITTNKLDESPSEQDYAVSNMIKGVSDD